MKTEKASMEPQLLEKIFSEYSTYLQVEKGLAAATRRGYLKAAQRLLETARRRPQGLLLPPDWDWHHLDRRALEIYLNTLRDTRGWKPASVSQQTTALRAFFHCLQVKGHVARNPLRDQGPRLPPRRPARPEGEVAAVRALFEPPPQTLAEARAQLAAELMYGGGLRPAQAYRVQALRLRRDAVRLRLGEAEELELLLSAEGLARARAYLATRRAVVGRRSGAPFWVDDRGRACSPARLGRAVRQAMERAGLPGGPATLRQLAARHFSEQGGDVRSVQRLLRAKRLGTLDRYRPMDFREVSEQFRRFHPRAAPERSEP